MVPSTVIGLLCSDGVGLGTRKAGGRGVTELSVLRVGLSLLCRPRKAPICLSVRSRRIPGDGSDDDNLACLEIGC
jgi:hypothetical protein